MEYAVLLLPLCGLVADAQLHAGEKMDRGARQDNLRWFTVIHVEQASSLPRAFSSQPPFIQAPRHARSYLGILASLSAAMARTAQRRWAV